MSHSHDVPQVSPSQLKAMLRDGGELALLDVREQGFFSQGHLLLAVPVPISHLELRMPLLAPRLNTRIVLCDEEDGTAELAGQRLAAFGYTEVSLLAGGLAGWREAGYEVFSGVNVPSKAFGEFVEHTYGTPSVSAEELKEMLDAGEDLVVLDSRPMDEYQRMNIPTGVDVPGAELAYRVADLAPSPDTLVVVNCAGRTRSIIGAQSLINAGIPNRVVALRNGTMGWHLAGFHLEHGNQRRAPEVSPGGLEKARAAAERVARRFGVREIDRETLARWQGESGERSLYLLDVRHPEEFEAGHLPGALHAPGGQLVQATDAYMAVRGARVVLSDDTGVRSRMTASWLIQLGWEAYVLSGGLEGGVLETGPVIPMPLGMAQIQVEEIAPEELAEALKTTGVVVLDLATSREHAASHVEGAWWGVRSRLKENLAKLPPCTTLVLTSPDGLLARLAAPEARAASPATVKVLKGGTQAWNRAGLPVAEGLTNPVEEVIDVFRRPYDNFGRSRDVEAAMHEYLSWELELVEQIERDGDARFQVYPEK